MFYYVLGDNKGNFIGKRGNNYISVYGIDNAEQFDTREKAANIRKSSLPAILRATFDVIAMQIEVQQAPAQQPRPDTKTNKDVNTIKNIAATEINNGEIPKWLDGVKTVVQLVSTMEGRRNELIDQLSKVDLEITDIQHYIELSNLNAYEGWLAFSMLKNRLCQRRKYKDELDIIRSLGTSNFTQQSVIRLNGMISHLHTRTYSPRVLTGLFDSATVAPEPDEKETPAGIHEEQEEE